MLIEINSIIGCKGKRYNKSSEIDNIILLIINTILSTCYFFRI